MIINPHAPSTVRSGEDHAPCNADACTNLVWCSYRDHLAESPATDYQANFDWRLHVKYYY
jgi:hypothetical protein